MALKLSHLYNEKTIDVVRGDTVLFRVTVQEIPTGEAAKIQNESFKLVDMEKVTANSKQGRRKQVAKQINQAMKEVNGGELAIRETLLGVKSWTLLDDDGHSVPVGFAAWMLLPKYITKQIEDAVEELNPELDEEFPDEVGNQHSA